MPASTYEWARAEERALARYVQPEALPKELSWPVYINRLDLLTAEGPAGVVGQLYNLVYKLKIQYDLSPFNPRAGVTQLIRRPMTILVDKQATCLDMAVLFATLGLANDLLPLIVVVDGHALAGFSVTRTRHANRKSPKPYAWQNGLLSDLGVLRELAGREYLFLECTGASASQSLSKLFPEGCGRESGGQMSFERACAAGEEQIRAHARLNTEPVRENQREFLYALDIHALQTRYGFEPTPEVEAAQGQSAAVFNQAGQTVQGNQTNIANAHGPVLSGSFRGPVQVGDIRVGNITNSTGIAIGSGAQATVTQTSGVSADEIARAFAAIMQKVNALPEGPGKQRAQSAAEELKKEAKKGQAAEEENVHKWLGFLAGASADAWEVALNTFISPIAGLSTVFKKVAERAKAEKGK